MENAVKALLIAAGCFITMMVISLIFITRENVAEYYENMEKEKIERQLLKENSKFLGYTDHDIRGNELISLMNTIIDYNNRESYNSTKGFEKIKIKIEIPSSVLDDFMFLPEAGVPLITGNITNTGAGANNYNGEKAQLLRVANTPLDLIKILKNNVGLDKADEDCLKQLSSRISDIVIKDTPSLGEKALRETIIKDIFGLPTAYDLQSNQIDEIVKVTDSYYQYVQFKRSMFEPKKVTYSEDTGRINYMEFKIKIDGSSGEIVMD